MCAACVNGAQPPTSSEYTRSMGVVLTPIITKETISLSALRGRTLAVDGNGELYQFLALIRLRDGTPLKDSSGRITSHLAGLFYRTTRLIEIRDTLGEPAVLDEVRRIYLAPNVTGP